MRGERAVEECTDIAIDEHFVIHVLDNRLPEVQCSEDLTPLPEELRAILKAYLLSLLKPRFRRKQYGRFRPESPVLREYQELLARFEQHGHVEATDFLAVSQRIAGCLFNAMKPSGHNGLQPRLGDITPGDLLLGLFYERAPQASPVPYLFLIKADLESALQRQIQPRDRGGMQTVLTRQEGLMPKLSAQHIQKSVLIRCANDASTYDVVMTDPQGGKRGIAKFFAENFLHTEPFRSADEQAELLFRRANAWIVEHEATLSPQERGEVRQSVRTLLEEHGTRAEPVTPRQLVEALPLTEAREPVIVQELRQSFEETLTLPTHELESIPVDRELLIQHVPQSVVKTRVTYELDYGVLLSGDQEAITHLFAQPPRRIDDGTEFIIHTRTFRPIL